MTDILLLTHGLLACTCALRIKACPTLQPPWLQRSILITEVSGFPSGAVMTLALIWHHKAEWLAEMQKL